MKKDKEKLNNGEAPEKKKFMKSVASWFVEEEEEPAPEAAAEAVPEVTEEPEFTAPAEAPAEPVQDGTADVPAEPASAPAETARDAAQDVPAETPRNDAAPVAAAASAAPSKAAAKPVAREKAKKDKKSKDKKNEAENGSQKPGKKKRRIPGILVFLIIVVILAAAFYIHVHTDLHSRNTENRGTVIGDTYCYYIESKDAIVKYSTSRGPKTIKNTDEEFETLWNKLKPADRSAEKYEHADDVAAVIGDGFNKANYTFIDYASKCVLFSYPNEGVPALWIYNEKYGTAEPVVTGAHIRGIAFGNFIIYARDDDQNRTVCYRVSTSYSGQVLSVDEFRTVSKSPVTFWSSVFWDFVRGLARGLKASTDSR